MFGAHNSQIATLVERQTRYVMLAKVASKDTETVVDALIKGQLNYKGFPASQAIAGLDVSPSDASR